MAARWRLLDFFFPLLYHDDVYLPFYLLGCSSGCYERRFFSLPLHKKKKKKKVFPPSFCDAASFSFGPCSYWIDPWSRPPPLPPPSSHKRKLLVPSAAAARPKLVRFLFFFSFRWLLCNVHMADGALVQPLGKRVPSHMKKRPLLFSVYYATPLPPNATTIISGLPARPSTTAAAASPYTLVQSNCRFVNVLLLLCALLLYYSRVHCCCPVDSHL